MGQIHVSFLSNGKIIITRLWQRIDDTKHYINANKWDSIKIISHYMHKGYCVQICEYDNEFGGYIIFKKS